MLFRLQYKSILFAFFLKWSTFYCLQQCGQNLLQGPASSIRLDVRWGGDAVASPDSVSADIHGGSGQSEIPPFRVDRLLAQTLVRGCHHYRASDVYYCRGTCRLFLQHVILMIKVLVDNFNIKYKDMYTFCRVVCLHSCFVNWLYEHRH